jgi:hypothetical protein
LGEDVGGGVVVTVDDVGVVGVTAAGHRRVETAAVDGAVDEEEGEVDGAALGGVAGLGVTEFEMFSGVVGGEPRGAGWSGDGHPTIRIDTFDRPVVPVLDHGSAVGSEAALVVTGDDFVTVTRPGICSGSDSTGRWSYASTKEVSAGVAGAGDPSRA